MDKNSDIIIKSNFDKEKDIKRHEVLLLEALFIKFVDSLTERKFEDNNQALREVRGLN